MKTISHDKESDAVYISLMKGKTVAKTFTLMDGQGVLINVDADKDGNILGVEII